MYGTVSAPPHPPPPPPLHPYRTVKMFRHSAAILQKVFFQLNLTQSDPSVLESYFREVITLLVNLPLAPSGDVSEKEQKGNKESSKDSVVVQVVADRDIDEKKHIGIHGWLQLTHPSPSHILYITFALQRSKYVTHSW